jgi:hypothetical protein
MASPATGTCERLVSAPIREYIANELPIRFGCALSSKLRKRYWEQPECQGKPFVIAVEPFHDEEALFVTDAALSTYVYGIQQTGELVQDAFKIETQPVLEHIVSAKATPSGFFQQPNVEHISGILFTNSGTQAKFTRMAYETGYGNDSSQ